MSDGEPLYDTTAKTWCMPDLGRQTVESRFAMFLNTITKGLLKFFPGKTLPPIWYASHSTRPVGNGSIKRKPDLVLSDEVDMQWNNMLVVAELSSTTYTAAMRAGKTLDTKAWLMFKDQPWRRFVVLLSFLNDCRELRVHLYDHSGGIVTPPVNIDQEPHTFIYIMACIVFGKRSCIGFDHTITINTKMIPEVSDMFWARNIKKLPKRKTVANDHSESRTPPVLLPTIEPYIAPFHSHPVYFPPSTAKNKSSVPSLPPHRISTALADEPVMADSKHLKSSPHTPDQSDSDEPIGDITVNEHKYILLKVLFSCQGLVGRGTVCYLARRDGEEYIIKDHWVKGNKDTVLNEVKMLEEMKGVAGVPELVEFWLVEVEEGQPDETRQYRKKIESSALGACRTHVRLVLKPRARPLYMFRSKKELVRILRDVVLIQQCAVETHQIVHKDCSLNNIMIEDWEGDSRGALIDWEFASRITPDNTYPAGGTGTIPFMSIDLLHQMGKIQLQESQKGAADRKGTSASIPAEIERVKHFYRDDLEALFYVFVWICIVLKGPTDTRRELHPLNRRPKGSTAWLPEEWHGSQLDVATCAKEKAYFFSERAEKLRLSEQFDPYFKDLVPLAEQWYDLLRKKRLDRKDAEFNNTKAEELHFDDVSSLLETHLAALPDDERGPYFVVSQLELHESLDKLNHSFKENNVLITPNPTGEKAGENDVEEAGEDDVEEAGEDGVEEAGR